MHVSNFSFRGVKVSVATDARSLKDRLERDFSSFLSDGTVVHETPTRVCCRIDAQLRLAPASLVNQMRKGFRTKNAIVHNRGHIRINDYYSEALSVYDFDEDRAQVFSLDINRLHEITYLLVLSRVGKSLDLAGLHRIHAMGVAYRGRPALCLMPMGGGKTTLFLNMLHMFKTQGLEIISDDSPLVGKKGEILPFPLRVGVTPQFLQTTAALDDEALSFVYDLDRMRYGKKHLIPIYAFGAPIFSGSYGERPVVLRGVRTSGRECRIKKASFLSIYPSVFMNMVVGLGLPIMREYFIENSWRDLARVGRILLLRLVASLRLVFSAERYVIFLGTDHSANAQAAGNMLCGGESAKQALSAKPR